MSRFEVRDGRSGRSALALSLLLGLLWFVGCNQDGTSGAGIDIRNAGSTHLTLLSNSPADDEIQVPLSTAIELTFDGPIHPDGLDDEVIGLRDSQGNKVAGSFLTRSGGRVVIFQPTSALHEAADYLIDIDGNLCDTTMRAMNGPRSIRFRTLDHEAPKVTAVTLGGSQTAAPRSGAYRIEFDERIDTKTLDGSTVQLLDERDVPQSVDLAFSGKTLVMTIVRDLPGSSALRIRLQGGPSGVADISGNPIAVDWFYPLTTAVDTVAPTLINVVPSFDAKGVSPRARHSFLFSESLSDPTLDRPVATLFDDQSRQVAIHTTLSRDGRSLHVFSDKSLTSGKSYRLHIQGGATGIEDRSGNALLTSYNVPFEVGFDDQGPQVLSQSPLAAQDPVSVNARVEVGFDEKIDPATVRTQNFQLFRGNTLIAATVDSISDTEIYLLPAELLDPSTDYRIRVKSGYDGIRDPAGNPLAEDLDYTFRTSKDVTLPDFEIYPMPSSSSVPLDVDITMVANAPLLPGSVDKDTVRIIPSGMSPLTGTLTLERNNRVIRFVPDSPLPALAVITLRIEGGPEGVRLDNGNWLTTDTIVSFRSGLRNDSGSKPQFRFSFNGIAPERMGGIHLPPSGFSIDIEAYDAADAAVDMSSLQLTLQGPDIVPTAEELFSLTTFHGNNASLAITPAYELPIGDYKISARVADSAGHMSDVQSYDFSIVKPMSGDVPFETTQFVHVRFDLDRENGWKGDGTPDFDGDLYDLGLLAKGDPIGKNAYMRQLVIDGILGVANQAYGRAADGKSLPGSVNIRFLSRKPCGDNYTQIAFGGMDPHGSSSRKFGDPTTGILGRAWYDYKNGNFRDDDTATSPGLGVFSGELFLHQARIYLDLKKWYLSTWARTYDGLSPHLDGTPVGRHVLDATILAPGWNYGTAPNGERARWDEIMRGADDFAQVTGTILAHEVGHSVGLVAPGGLPSGLHGDSSLHNSTSGLGDIMSAVIGYEGLLVVDYSFRGLSMSYLRQSLLLK